MHKGLGFSLPFEMWIGILIRHQTAADHRYHKRLTFDVLLSNACCSSTGVLLICFLISCQCQALYKAHLPPLSLHKRTRWLYREITQLSWASVEPLIEKGLLHLSPCYKLSPACLWELHALHPKKLLVKIWVLLHLRSRDQNYSLVVASIMQGILRCYRTCQEQLSPVSHLISDPNDA